MSTTAVISAGFNKEPVSHTTYVVPGAPHQGDGNRANDRGSFAPAHESNPEYQSIQREIADLRLSLSLLKGNSDDDKRALAEQLDRVSSSVREVTGLAAQVRTAFDTAIHVKDSVVKTVAEIGSRVMDAVAGYSAISSKGSPAPFDHMSRGFLAFRGCSDLALVWTTLRDTASAAGETLLDPALDTLAKLGERVASLAQIGTRIGYLGAVLGMITFPPILHMVNIASTGAAGLLATIGSLGEYHTCLILRRSGYEDAENAKGGQITALLKIAANVSLVVFAVLSAQATSLSMVPITVGTGTALAVSAGFSILAKLNEKLTAMEPEDRPSFFYSAKV